MARPGFARNPFYLSQLSVTPHLRPSVMAIVGKGAFLRDEKALAGVLIKYVQ